MIVWLMSVFGCNNAPAPLVEASAELGALDGRTVVLQGIYRRVDVRMMGSDPPVFDGHAAIELSDRRRILLEPTWSDAARRPAAEQQLEGKLVRAEGIYRARMPDAPEAVAMPLLPCLEGVSLVRAIP